MQNSAYNLLISMHIYSGMSLAVLLSQSNRKSNHRPRPTPKAAPSIDTQDNKTEVSI